MSGLVVLSYWSRPERSGAAAAAKDDTEVVQCRAGSRGRDTRWLRSTWCVSNLSFTRVRSAERELAPSRSGSWRRWSMEQYGRDMSRRTISQESERNGRT